MPRYLVTGAAGFVGSRVSELLLADNSTVIGIDTITDAYDVRLKQWRLKNLQNHSSFIFDGIDVRDRDALARLFDAHGPFDAVLNLAGRAGVRQSVEDPWSYIETNLTGTLNLLELCRSRQIAKFVLASSSSVYGQDINGPCREDAETDHPLSPYAASKKAAEALCYSYHYLHKIDITVLRYFTVYGPAGRPDMAPFRFVQWISEGKPVRVFGDGLQSRDFTYIDDIAKGTIAALKPIGYSVINLGSDGPMVLIDVIKLIENLTGREARIEYQSRHSADVPATWADISRAANLLSWRPLLEPRAGFKNLVEWYNDNRDWASKIKTD